MKKYRFHSNNRTGNPSGGTGGLGSRALRDVGQQPYAPAFRTGWAGGGGTGTGGGGQPFKR